MGGITTIINKVKYIGIASLTIAILSVLTLNIISSYSSSNIESNAIDSNSEVSTLVQATGPATISLSITSSSSSSTGGNDPNLSLTIPQGGGIATGRHTIAVTSNSYAGYSVTVEGSGNTTDMSASDFGSGTSSNNELIKSTTATINNPAILSTNTWGIAIPGKQGYSNESTYELGITNPNDESTQTTLAKATFGAVPPKLAGETIMSSSQATGTNHDGSSSDNQNIYYGANVEQFFRAGTYSEEVVYTATVKLPSNPTITSVSPNQYELGSNGNSTVTIEGANLASAYRVWIDLNNSNTYDTNEQCTNLNIESNTKLTCNVPTDQTIPTLDTGTHTIYVQTQAEQPGKLENAFTYTKPSICRNADPDSDCQVDIDDNMIPVTYDEERQVWIALNERQINSLTGIWYDYGAKKWANAVTVKNPDNYRESKDVNEDDILGYWVYIPRYAYKVQRRDAYNPTNQTSANSAVSAQNFDIVFETKNDPVKQPIECNTGDYQTCVKNQYGASALNYPNTTSQDDPSNNQTAWATHPAFTWKYTQAINGFDQTTELNGFWIGKFETTGTRTAPTVKPNQHANIYEYIGEFYSAAKSIGQPDSANKYGGADTDNTTSSLKQNSHNLAVSTSHMLKNSEWGAVAYLSASRYGAGVNKVQINAAMLASGSTDADGDKSQYGATGCGPESNGVKVLYNAGTLNETTIESSTACGSADRAYNGTIGQYASTTNNVYGVYDMSGGTDEYVMGNYSTNLSQTSNGAWGDEVKIPIKPPYVDIYNITSADDCTWSVGGSGCGGHALFETTSWGYTGSGFAESSFSWFGRGGHVRGSSTSGVFARSWASGITSDDSGFRVALLALPLN